MVGGRYWPGISAVSAPPGIPAASSWTHSGLMSSSIAIRAPWSASAAARSAGTADMLAAYTRSPAASWPIALRATYAPPPRVAPHIVQSSRRRGRPSVQHQRLQVLPDAVDSFARRGQPTAPDPDPGLPGPVEHQAGEARPQRTDHVPFLHVAARACRQLEPPVERGEKLAAFGAGHSWPGAHQPRCGRAGVCAAVVQDVTDRAEEGRNGHEGAVCGPHAGDAYPRPGQRRRGRGAPGRRCRVGLGSAVRSSRRLRGGGR